MTVSGWLQITFYSAGVRNGRLVHDQHELANRATCSPSPEWATGSGSIDEGGERPCQPRGGVRVPAEKQMWLDPLPLPEHPATVPLPPLDPRPQPLRPPPPHAPLR